MLVLPDRLGQLLRTGAVYSYSRETLFEYINGHAEFYLSAGFVGLVGSEYQLHDDSAPVIRVDSYDMEKDLHAFGALMEGAGADGRPVNVGTRGFETDTALTFVAGPYLFRITATGPGPDLPTIGRRLVEVLGIDVSAEPDVDFPIRGKVLRTTFIKENYKSLSFLANVVERHFLIDGEEVTAFITSGQEGSSAEEVQQALLSFLEYDEIAVEIIESGDYRVHFADDPYEGKWFFLLIDDSLLGVFAEPSPSLLERLPGSKESETGVGK